MKMRNRKLLTTLVAIFTFVLLAGSAFAFTSQGPLIFQGTATVDASLELSIVEGVLGSPDLHERYNATARVIQPTYGFRQGVREANFEVGFTRPTPSIPFHFTVENTGTLPAVITGVNFVNYLDGYLLQPGHSGWDLWGQVNAHGVPFSIVAHMWYVGDYNWSDIENAVDELVLQPGESAFVGAYVRFLTGWGAADIANLGIGHELKAEFVSTLTLDYGIYTN